MEEACVIFTNVSFYKVTPAGDWNADGFDDRVSEAELLASLGLSPWAAEIPGILRSLRERLSGAPVRRLTQD